MNFFILKRYINFYLYKRNNLFLFLLFSSALGYTQPSVTIQKDAIGSSIITFCASCPEKIDSSIVFVHLHEDESTAALAAKQVLQTDSLAYCLIQLRQNKKRLISFIYEKKKLMADPNRMFTPHGALATLKQYCPDCTDTTLEAAKDILCRLAENYIHHYIDHKRLVVALHNNADEGLLNIAVYRNGSEAKNAADVYINTKKDPDDFFLTTEKNIFKFLKAAQYNVVLQNNEQVYDDGSLSVYAAKNNIPYINIEAQKDHLKEQKRMIKIVLDFIKKESLYDDCHHTD